MKNQPSPHRVGVDLGRVGGERLVDLGDLARDRRINLACRLDRFDDRRLLALLDPVADLGQLDIDDVAHLRLGIVGDADHGEIAVEPDPFMVFGEAKRHGSSAVFLSRERGRV